MSLSCVSRTVPGNRTKSNEDAWLALPELGLFAVADGMGGHHHGAIASRTALQAIHAELSRPAITAQRIRRAILGAHASLCVQRRGRDVVGTTIVVAWIAGGYAHCFHLGDSRAYRFRNYLLERITRDHCTAGEDLGKRGIVPTRKRAIGRALGMRGDVLIGCSSLDWLSGDRLLMLTDGISDNLQDLEIANILATYQQSPVQALDSLIRRSEAVGGRDDKTAMLVFEQGS